MSKVKTFLILVLFAPLALLAEEAAAAVPAADGGIFGTGVSWKEAGLVLGGMLLMRALGWVAEWINGKGQKFVEERLTKLQEKLNSNEVLAQIAADDAVINIVKDAIPEVFAELSDTVKKDLADGKFDKVSWDDIGTRLWQKVKPHVEGGKSDYLKNSSFSDGKVLATYVAKKFFSKKKEEKANG